MRRGLDRETIELLRNDPDLLAIADAIVSTQRLERPRRPVLLGGGALSAAVAAVIVFVLVSPWSGSSGDLVDQALAAIGGGGNVRMIVERTLPDESVVEPLTGASRPVLVSIESWYGLAAGSLRSVTRRNGVVVSDVFQQRSKPQPALGFTVDPALQRFARDYPNALRTRQLAIENGSTARVPTLVLPASATGGTGVVVRLDPQTRLPAELLVRGQSWAVRLISDRFDQSDAFRTAQVIRRPSRGSVIASKSIGLTNGAILLRPWIAGARLVGVRAEVLSSDKSGNATGYRLSYRDRNGWVEVEEARSAQPAYGFFGNLTMNFDPVPSGGRVVVSRLADQLWRGQMRIHGVYLTIKATSRPLLLAAARALVSG